VTIFISLNCKSPNLFPRALIITGVPIVLIWKKIPVQYKLGLYLVPILRSGPEIPDNLVSSRGSGLGLHRVSGLFAIRYQAGYPVCCGEYQIDQLSSWIS